MHTVTGHAGLAGNTGRDEDDLRALESIAEARGGRVVASDGAVGVDVAQIGSDTCKRLLLVDSDDRIMASRWEELCDVPGPPRIS